MSISTKCSELKMYGLSSMKFYHRVIAVCVLTLMSFVVYFSISDNQAQLKLQQQHRRLLRGQHYVGAVLEKQVDRGVCGLENANNHANISTVNLYQTTQFNIRSDGMYEMPVPTLDPKDHSRLPRLNVILMPHSHNDPGWLRTVNEYYTDQTKNILNNMVNKLTEYPNMTFVWAETVFLSMWWNELDDVVKVHVRRLIRRGQLEIVLGGWVMPDEASTHYVSVIDQLTEGHQWLWENLGVKPKNSWSIDPFGYSGTMQYIWKQAGMPNMVIQRVHQAIKNSLAAKKALEFNWRQMWDTKGSTDIFCHIMPFMLYSIKFTCGPNPFACLHFDFRQIAGDFSESRARQLTPENLKSSAESLNQQYRAKSAFYRYNTILVPIGDDFRYDKELEWTQQYENYEKLIHYLNHKPEWNIRVKWGTLKDYFELTKEEHTRSRLSGHSDDFPVLSGDFFPYSDRDSAYWTGYYTTRPFDKAFSRDLQSRIQAADILTTLTYMHYKKLQISPKTIETKFFQLSGFLQQARRSLGLFMHHDAITGTAKDFVVQDYEDYLKSAYDKTTDVMKLAIQALLSKGKVESPVVFKSETIRKTSKSLPEKQVIKIHQSGTNIVFFNPLAHHQLYMISLYVDYNNLAIVSYDKKSIPYQTSPIWLTSMDAYIMEKVYEVTFLLELSPLALTPFVFYKKDNDNKLSYSSTLQILNTIEVNIPEPNLFPQQRNNFVGNEPLLIQNKQIQLSFDRHTGSLLSIMDLETQNVTKINLKFLYYKSQGSGAYIFYPNGPAKNLFRNIPVFRVIEGPMKSCVEISFQPYLVHRVTLYHYPSRLTSSVFIENELSIQTLQDKEIIMRISTDIKSEDSFYSDQNGFQFIRRRFNKNLGIEANYYPMTSGAILEDEVKRVTLISAQPHGVASLRSGDLEVMLDRQLVYDDNRGMGEGVFDIKTTRSKFVLSIEKISSPRVRKSDFTMLSLKSLSLHDSLQQPPLAFYTSIDTDVFYNKIDTVYSGLPCDTTVVSLRSLCTNNLNYNGTSVILHRRGYDCSFPNTDSLCVPSDSSMSLNTLFNSYSFTNIHQTSLTLTEVKRNVRVDESLNIQPMELASYHVKF